jgi:hypothetical protein
MCVCVTLFGLVFRLGKAIVRLVSIIIKTNCTGMIKFRNYCDILMNLRSEVLTAVKMSMLVFWVVTPRELVRREEYIYYTILYYILFNE